MTGSLSSSKGPLWRGRTLAVLGIVLCAFSLRSAVASLSPVVDLINADFTVSSAVLGVIGTLPPVCFAVFGLITPLLERRLGIERLTVIALLAITVGLVWRGLVGESIGLLLATTLIFAGVGSMLAAAAVLLLSSPDKARAAITQGVFPLIALVLVIAALTV